MGLQKYILMREHHKSVFSSQIIILEPFPSYFLFFPSFINIFTFSNPKIYFPPTIKGFQSSKGIWKHLIDTSLFCIHLLHLIDHLRFLNLKIPKIFVDFNLITFFSVDSTSTRHCSSLKIEFKELSIIFDT